MTYRNTTYLNTTMTSMSEPETVASVVLTERQPVQYSMKEEIIMENSKKIVLLEIKNKTLTGESVLYDNQEECSLQIVSNLHNKKIINIMVIAKTQSGKTGTMIALTKNYLNDTTNLIPIENIYIITGLSSREWVDQTTNRMPKSIQDRIIHRDKLKPDFVKDIRSKQNVLIIIDEIQIASKEKQTLHQVFDKSGFYNKQHLLKNDIKIIEFTATPDGTIYDLMNWGENATKLKMEPAEGYTSCFDFKNQRRVFQYKDLCGYSKKTNEVDKDLVSRNIAEVEEHLGRKPRYHIIRTPSGGMGDIVVENFKEFFGDDAMYYKYDKESEILDINNVLKHKPKIHTFIFIKEKLRCAKTLHKRYLRILYERYTKTQPYDSVIIQGLIGRATGYDDRGKCIIFTNIPSIDKYKKLWDSNFEDKTVRWKSNTTTRKNDILHSKGTYMNPTLVDGMSVSSEEDTHPPEPIIRKFRTQEEVKQYYIDHVKPRLGGRGPKKRYPNKDGYYVSTIGTVHKPCTTTEIFQNRNLWLKSQKNPYRLYPCYEDLSDTSTLQFWIIHS